MPSLSDKLKSLGVKTGTSHLAPPQPVRHTIDTVVAGSFLSTPRGEAFVSEQIFDEGYLHGTVSHLSTFPLSLISQWANDPRIADLPIHKFAFLDTETSGMAGEQARMPFWSVRRALWMANSPCSNSFYATRLKSQPCSKP